MIFLSPFIYRVIIFSEKYLLHLPVGSLIVLL